VAESTLRDSGNGRRRGRPVDQAKLADILSVATRVFLERGYSAASMDLIARRAGVSKITIYAHFSNKAALFAAIIDSLAGRLTKAINGWASRAWRRSKPWSRWAAPISRWRWRRNRWRCIGWSWRNPRVCRAWAG